MNTKRQLIAFLLYCFAAVLPCHAQNSIDELVENFSTLGSAKFTSVVDRDPKTRRVLKVVKELQLQGLQAGKFKKAFEDESRNGSTTRQQDGDVLTMTITQESPRQLRIYMLRLVGRHTYHSAKVIIIVKMKT